MSNMSTSPIAVLSDIHFTKKINRTWLENNYFTDQLSRLLDVYDFCEELGVEDLIITGDVFDVWDEISLDFINQIIDVINKCPCNIYTIIGNHDILLGNESSLDQSTLGFVFKYSKLKRLKTGDRVSLGTVEVIDWFNPKREVLEKDLVIESDHDVIVAHTKVGPKKTDWCAGVDEIDIIGPRWMFIGDQHQGHNTVIAPSGCKIINPGGFTLKSSDEVTRVPKVCFVYEDREVYKELPVSVITTNLIKTKQPVKKNKINPVVTKSANIDELIKEASKVRKFSKKVITYLKSRLNNE